MGPGIAHIWVPPRVDEVHTVKNTEDGQTVCPQIWVKWKNETCDFRRQSRFSHFHWISSARFAKLVFTHVQASWELAMPTAKVRPPPWTPWESPPWAPRLVGEVLGTVQLPSELVGDILDQLRVTRDDGGPLPSDL